MRGVTEPMGFRANAVAAHVKANTRRLDLALIESSLPAVAAGVFTRNRVKAAPVIWSQKVLQARRRVRAVLINAGNANACTGRGGMLATRSCARAVAQQLGCLPQEILVASTGVIGEPLPTERLVAGVPALLLGLADTPKVAQKAARAIMTTDLVPKSTAIAVQVGRRTYTVGGVAKGSGMIHPNMATMLGVLTCDAPLTPGQARRLLRAAVQKSFNSISVDGDTSTNDCVFLLANGAAGGKVPPGSAAEAALAEAILRVCMHLAEAIVKDGEGAKRLLVMRVTGAKNSAQALQIARTVVGSSLVKTALAGGDPNWGRVVAAAGRAGVALRPDLLQLTIGHVIVAQAGAAVPGSEARAARFMRKRRVVMELRVGRGRGEATALGCDLTHAYVDINAHYRT